MTYSDTNNAHSCKPVRPPCDPLEVAAREPCSRYSLGCLNLLSGERVTRFPPVQGALANARRGVQIVPTTRSSVLQGILTQQPDSLDTKMAYLTYSWAELQPSVDGPPSLGAMIELISI